MRTITSKILGPLVLQHSGYDKAGFDLDYRACLYGARIKNQLDGPGQIGHWLGDKDSIGDIHGGQLLSNDRAKRPVPMWRFATPMIIAGGGGGGGPGKTQANGPTAGASFSGVRTNFSSGSANAGASFSGVRSNFSNGGPNAGINVPLLNQTTPKEPGTGGQEKNPPSGEEQASGKPKCPEFSGPNTMVPIFDDSFAGDARFHPLVGAVPKRNGKNLWNKMPVGTVGISLVANDERNQIDLFMPTDPRIYAVNRSDCKMGTLVCDLDPEKFAVDDEAMAHLQSAFWVIKKPLGKKFNVLAVQLGLTGCEDTEGGYVIDKSTGGGGQAGGPGKTVVGGGGKSMDDKVLGLMSMHRGGPLDVGTGKCKHKKGEDEDGHPIDSCHITTNALFRRNDTEDGPLDFTVYKKPGADGNIRVPVYLGWRGDVWAWWTTNWFMPPPPPPPPSIPTDPLKPSPIHPEKPGGGTTTGGGGTSTGGGVTIPVNQPVETPVEAPFEGPITGEPGSPATSTPPVGPSPNPPPAVEEDDPFDPVGNRIKARRRKLAAEGAVSGFIHSAADLARSALNVVTMMAALGMQAAMAVPQNYSNGMINQGLMSQGQISDEAISKTQNSTPLAGGMSSFGSQGGTKGSGSATESKGATGDPWRYTQEPGKGKYAGGTTSGGWVIHPPETDLRDATLYGMAPTNVTLSTTYFLVAPGAWFGAGVPELVDGSIKEGYSWGMDSATGDLLFRSHSGLVAPSTAMRFSKSAQNFSWRSSTLFWGEFEHANTADRVYTFPDASGTIPLGTGTAGQVAFWSATNTLAGDPGLTYDAATDKLTITSTSGAQLRLAYDVGNYAEFTTNSSGSLSIAPTGAAVIFSTSDVQLSAGNLLISRSNSGGEVSARIRNLSNTASSTAILYLDVAGTSAGDCFVRYDVQGGGGVTWVHGVDTSIAGRPFVISASSALGTANVMQMTTAGNVGLNVADSQFTLNFGGTAPIPGTAGACIGLSQTVPSNATARFSGVQLGLVTAAAAFTLTDMIGIYIASMSAGAGSTITRATGFVCASTLPVESSNSAGYYYGTVAPTFTGDWAAYFLTGDNYFGGTLGIGLAANTVAARRLEVLDASNPQLRLTHTAATQYGEFQVDSGGNLVYAGTGTIFGHEKSSGGADLFFRVLNSSNTANSGSALILRTAGTSAGDAYIHFQTVGGQSWAVGYDASASYAFKVSANTVPGSTDYLTITTAGLVGILTSPSSGLDVANTTLRFGAQNSSGGRADATTKFYTSVCPHYTNAQGAFTAMAVTAGVTNNQIDIGGNDGSYKAATIINFFTAADSVTATGTERMRIASTGATTIHQWLNIGTAVDATAQGDFAAGLTGAARAWYDQSAQTLYLFNSSGTNTINLIASGNSEIVSPNTASNLLLRNSSNSNRVTFNFGTSSNHTRLTMTDSSEATAVDLNVAAGFVFNEQQSDLDLRVEGDTLAYHFFLDATATTENAAFFATAAPNWQTMDRGFFIGDTTNAPTGNPASGHFYYSDAGGPVWLGSSGGLLSMTAAGQVFIEFSHASTTSGLDITNSSTGDATIALSAGDAWTLGIDQSVSSRFAIANTTVLGGVNDVLRITTDGGWSYVGQGFTHPDATEFTHHDFNVAGGTVTFTTGATLATQRAVRIRRPTYAATSATQTITDAATLYIENAPAAGTNLSITNPYALWVDDGKVRFDSDVAIGTSVFPTGTVGKVLAFGDNGGNPTMGTNTAGLFAKDVSGTVEMFAIGEDSVATQISSHNPRTGEWWVNNYSLKEKKQKTFHVERFLRDLCEKVPEIQSKISIESYWETIEMEEMV